MDETKNGYCYWSFERDYIRGRHDYYSLHGFFSIYPHSAALLNSIFKNENFSTIDPAIRIIYSFFCFFFKVESHSVVKWHKDYLLQKWN